MQLLEDVPLAPRCTLGVGGSAAHAVDATSEAEALAAITWAERYRVPLRVLGGGSNVVIADRGVSALVLRLQWRGIEARAEGDDIELTAAAGEPWDDFVASAVERGLSGIECLSGIPGLVGATPIQNVGAYGQEVAETITRVRAFDRVTKQVVTLGAAECRFAYRDSAFKSLWPERFVVLSVSYRLRRGGAPRVRYPELARFLASQGHAEPSLEQVRRAVLEVRRSKSMVWDPADPNARSCGSFFVNPIVDAEALPEVQRRVGSAELPAWPQPNGRVKLSAAWLIERAGFTRGYRQGAVGLSSKHCLALVCHAGARATDVVQLARTIRRGVEGHSGVRLTPEPVFWGFDSLDDGLPDERLA